MSFLSIPGTAGSSLTGDYRKSLRQARLFLNTKVHPTLNGTVSNISALKAGNVKTESKPLLADTTTGSDLLTNTGPQVGLAIGDLVTGAGIPSGSSILSFPSANSIQISNNASATGTGVTLTTQSKSKKLVGTGTSFLAEIGENGGWIRIGSINVKVISVQSNTDATLHDAVIIPGTTGYRVFLNILTGLNTKFTKYFKVGQKIQVGEESSDWIAKVIKIISDTSIQLKFGREQAEDLLEYKILADTDFPFRLFTALDAGDATKITIDPKFTLVDLPGMSSGAKSEDTLTDGELTITAELGEVSPERQDYIQRGIYSYFNDAGDIVGQSWGVPVGQRSRDVEMEIIIVGYENDAQATDKMKRIQVYKASPMIDGGWVFDLSTPATLKLVLKCRKDPERRDPLGRPLWGIIGEVA